MHDVLITHLTNILHSLTGISLWTKGPRYCGRLEAFTSRNGRRPVSGPWGSGSKGQLGRFEYQGQTAGQGSEGQTIPERSDQPQPGKPYDCIVTSCTISGIGGVVIKVRWGDFSTRVRWEVKGQRVGQ